jgi:hypothetical protein
MGLRMTLRAGIAALLALAAVPAAAQEAPPPEQEQQPEPTAEEMEAIRKALEGDSSPSPAPASTSSQTAPRSTPSFNPDLSFVADVAAAWFSSPDPLQTGGHDPTRRGFNLQQLELTVGAAVDPYFRFDANLVFSQFGVEVEEVYATTLDLPFQLQARIGQFLTRFGRINNTHPHAWHFVDQPFAIGRVFGGEGNRGLGLEASWLAPLPWYTELVLSATDAGGEATARSFLGASGFEPASVLDLQLTSALKQFFELTPEWSLLAGVSVANGPNNTGHDNRTDVYGVDLFLRYRPTAGEDPTVLSLQTEWLYRRRQVPGDLLQDLTGYVYAFWRFDLRWALAARYELGLPATGLAGRVADDPLDPEWTRPRHRLSANLTFWPTEFSRIRLQAAADVPTWRTAPTISAFLAFEFAVGAHGAHAF